MIKFMLHYTEYLFIFIIGLHGGNILSSVNNMQHKDSSIILYLITISIILGIMIGLFIASIVKRFDGIDLKIGGME